MIQLHSINDFPEMFRGGAVAIGNFDGVHLGHVRLIERLRVMAESVGGPAVVFTFDPPPARLLRPRAAPEPLVWIDRKMELLAQLGVDATLVYPTNQDFLNLEAREFFDRVVRQRMGIKAMVEGPNFFFGHNRSGNVEVLRKLCAEANMPFEAPEPVEIDGQIVSSSRIRSLVAMGRLEEAQTMLGRPYRIRGSVVRGAGRGAKLGFPTANVGQIDTLLPGEGIYAARARAESVWHPAAVSLGPNPTFDEGGLKVEVYLIGFQGTIYDRPIEVDFLSRIRDIKRFDSVDALIEQMARDTTQTIEITNASINLKSNPPSSMIPWSRFTEIVHGYRRFVLTTHIRPDGDALGSELALAAILESLGKDVLLCNAFMVPPNLRFLDPQQKHRQLGVDVTAEQLADREVLVILDTTAWAQLGDMGEVVKNTKAVKVVLDHHVSGDDLGAELFKNPEAEATGRLVVEAADQLGVRLTPEIARSAFVALATDTGWFRFSSTTADTLRLAARLVEAGANPDRLYKELYETDSHSRLQLIGRALARAQVEMDGRLIYTWLDQADFAASGALPSDSEDIINMTLSVGGTEMAVILVEQPTGGFKVSLRSRCDVDCSAIAEQFGGGGHKKAAGAFLKKPLESARQNILDAVRASVVKFQSHYFHY